MKRKMNNTGEEREREKGKGREEKWGREAEEIEQISVYHLSAGGSAN